MIGRILCHDSLLKPITKDYMVGEIGKRPKMEYIPRFVIWTRK